MLRSGVDAGLHDFSAERIQVSKPYPQEQDPGMPSPFQRLQVEHFARADEPKFRWQTTDPYMARTERNLLACVPVGRTDRLLEVGCGEGGNLKLLETCAAGAVGVDYSFAKVHWASSHVGNGRFVCADARQLPFRNDLFDVILCRDVLHHVEDKRAVVDELVRVCRASGRIVIIEPNGRSPIMWLLGMLVRAERDLTPNSLRRVLALLDRRQVAEPDVILVQPFPIGRVVFHYRWGLSLLSASLAGVVLAAERLLGRLVTTDRWAYMIVTAVKIATGKPAIEESL
jgi:SAM-dependent methyltransferase